MRQGLYLFIYKPSFRKGFVARFSRGFRFMIFMRICLWEPQRLRVCNKGRKFAQLSNLEPDVPTKLHDERYRQFHENLEVTHRKNE